ncbi:hypothetical protein CVT25_010187 [Psilocybe cyanescens]|uniref:FMR1-interacting protein 1 conserved domain-containing protein n=1 Tax=Psilocybe cyanescens TaxID=93625 RepID=A0A409XCZ7_PSICY|nr:hypothetical protein CVT25_010187 [Psilocybe cyanescens]
MSSLPPPHPSLPLPPQPAASSSTRLPQNTHPAISYPSYYNSHYVQAYSQLEPAAVAHSNEYIAQTQNLNYAMQCNPSGVVNSFAPRPIWYESGNNRCTHPGCTFTGSAKTVQVHMMDRHLIYPPGWDKQKKKSEWDADPSLKGKPIPIQGTNVVLDSPEVLEAWIAERKRRFPTSSRVEDKKRKLQEAVARGQLDIVDNGRGYKRPKVESSDPYGRDETRRDKRPNNHQKSRAKQEDGQNRTQDSGWPRRTQNDARVPETKKVIALQTVSSNSGSGFDDEDQDGDGGAPKAVSSKIAPPMAFSIDQNVQAPVKESFSTSSASTKGANAKRVVLQPKLLPKNPFGSRPTLLRNLLLPEIKVTVSNLSQAIRFIVDNDFLRNVELKPGQADDNNKIQVVGLDQNVQESTSGPIRSH